MGTWNKQAWKRWAAAGMLAALVWGTLLSLSGQADVVVTTTGRYEGDVISDDPDMVIIRTDAGLQYIARADITSTIYPDFPNDSAKVQEVTGTAEYKRSAQIVWGGEAEGRWLELTPGTKLRPGDWIRTYDDSTVIATVAGQAVLAIEPNTEMTIKDLRKNDGGDIRVRLTLDAGQLWNDVGTLQSAQSQYIVETPAASCGVRGTIYTVVVEDDETTVGTIEGAVAVVQKAEGGEEVEVGANQQATLGREGGADERAIEAGLLQEWGMYARAFSRMRGRMRLDALFARVGLTRQQGMMASAGIGIALVVLGVVFIARRRK